MSAAGRRPKLLRCVVYWLMKEPDLEEMICAPRCRAIALVVTRQSLLQLDGHAGHRDRP